jgi:hypothetical protein
MSDSERSWSNCECVEVISDSNAWVPDRADVLLFPLLLAPLKLALATKGIPRSRSAAYFSELNVPA